MPGFTAAEARALTGHLDQFRTDTLAAMRCLADAGFYRERDAQRQSQGRLIYGNGQPWEQGNYWQHGFPLGDYFKTASPEVVSAAKFLHVDHLQSLPLVQSKSGGRVSGLGKLLSQLWLDGSIKQLNTAIAAAADQVGERDNRRANMELGHQLLGLSEALTSGGPTSSYSGAVLRLPTQDLGINQCAAVCASSFSGRAMTQAKWKQQLLTGSWRFSLEAALSRRNMAQQLPHSQQGQDLFSGSFMPQPHKDFYQSAREQLHFLFSNGYLTTLPFEYREAPATTSRLAAATAAAALATGAGTNGCGARLRSAVSAIARRGAGTAAALVTALLLPPVAPKWALALLMAGASAAVPAAVGAVLAVSKSRRVLGRKPHSSSFSRPGSNRRHAGIVRLSGNARVPALSKMLHGLEAEAEVHGPIEAVHDPPVDEGQAQRHAAMLLQFMLDGAAV